MSDQPTITAEHDSSPGPACAGIQERTHLEDPRELAPAAPAPEPDEGAEPGGQGAEPDADGEDSPDPGLTRAERAEAARKRLLERRPPRPRRSTPTGDPTPDEEDARAERAALPEQDVHGVVEYMDQARLREVLAVARPDAIFVRSATLHDLLDLREAAIAEVEEHGGPVDPRSIKDLEDVDFLMAFGLTRNHASKILELSRYLRGRSRHAIALFLRKLRAGVPVAKLVLSAKLVPDDLGAGAGPGAERGDQPEMAAELHDILDDLTSNTEQEIRDMVSARRARDSSFRGNARDSNDDAGRRLYTCMSPSSLEDYEKLLQETQQEYALPVEGEPKRKVVLSPIDAHALLLIRFLTTLHPMRKKRAPDDPSPAVTVRCRCGICCRKKPILLMTFLAYATAIGAGLRNWLRRLCGKDTNRHIPEVIRRYVLLRSNGRCEFPGCRRPGSHCHRITGWAENSATRSHLPGGLVNLCSTHHLRIIETGAVTVSGTAPDDLVWTRDGEPVDTRRSAWELAEAAEQDGLFEGRSPAQLDDIRLRNVTPPSTVVPDPDLAVKLDARSEFEALRIPRVGRLPENEKRKRRARVDFSCGMHELSREDRDRARMDTTPAGYLSPQDLCQERYHMSEGEARRRKVIGAARERIPRCIEGYEAGEITPSNMEAVARSGLVEEDDRLYLYAAHLSNKDLLVVLRQLQGKPLEEKVELSALVPTEVALLQALAMREIRRAHGTNLSPQKCMDYHVRALKEKAWPVIKDRRFDAKDSLGAHTMAGRTAPPRHVLRGREGIAATFGRLRLRPASLPLLDVSLRGYASSGSPRRARPRSASVLTQLFPHDPIPSWSATPATRTGCTAPAGRS